jgi:molecular chaperone HscB
MTPDSQRNFFELFGLPVGFDVDAADLGARYRELQRRLHPDRYASATDQERRLSMQLAALVNEAYQTLKDPVRRARYLLRLRGVGLGDETDTRMDPVFLAEQMELRERLEEAQRDAKRETRLAELADDLERRAAERLAELRACLPPAGERLARARELTRELQFLDKLRGEMAELDAGPA